MLLYVAGFALCITSPIVRSAAFGYSGVAAMILGIATAWFGKSIAAGTLECELREQLKTEASQTLRLQSALSRRAGVWVVLGFTILVLVLIVVYWNIDR